ncbi:LOW QUALITY PROTEIN: tafazzin [Eutrema salsugineum]|uniref:LOW QUALITY PROTEIN: tafazzin n=1 Tax=Eutrema salsugineum TaxID=72664 RepID=UPI000CED1049|nr:LOW QUALITY PROTEIN: tafazzin [Eutrema salsugineum]
MGIQWFDKADLWKSVLLLKLQLRDRFRIAVDDHRGRAVVFSTDGYFSSTIHRLVARLRNFRRESLPSSPAFYRRRVSKDLMAEEESALFRMLQALAVPLIGNACHVFMNGLNRVQVYGLEKLHDALLNRPKKKPLVTVSNHVASVDDPFVIASLLPPKLLLDARNLRWTLCATDRCFKNPVTSAFFRSVKVLPVSRGEGIYQQGMDMAISKLNSGGWVHIFPEGSRSRDGGKTMGSAKRGIGRLILDTDTLPMVVPFVHTGMQDIMPVGANVPRIGKTVTVIIGDPIGFDDLLGIEGSENVSRKHLYDAVSLRIGQTLYELKAKVDRVSLEQKSNMSHTSSDRAADIFHRIDWDSFGMGAHFSEESSTIDKQFSRTDDRVVSSCSDRQIPKRGVSSEGGISLKIKKFMDSTEIMGFAARGLLVNDYKSRGESANSGKRWPLNAWRKYLDVKSCDPWITPLDYTC